MHTSGTRRELVARGLGDGPILRRLLELQRHSEVAYEVALRRGRLDRPAARLARTLARQEREHGEGLVRALDGYGGRSTPAPHPADVPGLRRALRGGSRAFAAYAVAREADSVHACYEAMGAIRNVKLLAGIGAIMASEAQHLALWRELLGRDPVPQAFETGARVD